MARVLDGRCDEVFFGVGLGNFAARDALCLGVPELDGRGGRGGGAM